MDSNETYIYKSEINWSLLTERLTLPVKNQVVFIRVTWDTFFIEVK